MGERYGDGAGEAAEVLVAAVTDTLEARCEEMVRYDDVHEEELRDDPKARAARDGSCERLYERLVKTREKPTAIAGETYVARIGFSGKTLRDPVGATRLATTVIAKLAEGSADDAVPEENAEGSTAAASRQIEA